MPRGEKRWPGERALLVGILLLAAVLRLAQIGQLPPGLFLDEASVGANARLIARGGIDQYGRPLPVFFRALDDWKCGLFIYSAAPLLAVSEPTAVTVRLPAALWGLLAVLVTWALGRELYGAEAGLWAALFLAVTPWHVHYSRIAWQAITLTAVYPAAVLFAARWLRRRRVGDAALAGLLLALSLYTYTVAKLLVPATVLWVLFARLRDERRGGRRELVVFGLVLLLAAAPFALAYLDHYQAINHRLRLMMLPPEEIPRAFAAHLHPGFLWGAGDPNLRHTPGGALLGLYMAPLLAVGLFDLLRARRPQRGLLWLALLLAPLLGSLSEGYPHATRTLIWQPFLQIVAAGGTLALVRWLGARFRPRAATLARAAIGLLLLGSLIRFGSVYSGEYVERSRDDWYAGLVPALRAAAALRTPGEEVLMRTDSGHYAYWMFVTDPAPETIREHRARVDVADDRYDHLDVGNRYEFLGFRTLSRAQGALGTTPGLWVYPRAGVAPDRLAQLRALGIVRVVWENERYLLLRGADPVAAR